MAGCLNAGVNAILVASTHYLEEIYSID